MFSLSADPNNRGILQGEHPEILAQSDPPPVDFSHGDIRSQIAAEWLSQRSQWRAYIGNYHRSFEWCHRWPPTTSPSPKMGVTYAPKIREWPYLRNGWSGTLMFGSGVGFSGSADRMALFPVTSNRSCRQAAILDNLEWPYLRNGSFDPLI